MCDRQVYACHDMCGGQKATLNAGLYLLSLTVQTPIQLAHKLLGLLPSHLGSIRTVLYCTPLYWLSVALQISTQLLMFAWQALYPLSHLPSPGNAHEA